MAKKNFNSLLNNKKGELQAKNNRHQMQFNTESALEEASKNPSKENISKAMQAVSKDSILLPKQKEEFFKNFEERYIRQFEFCPKDYENLKLEAKFLARMSSKSFMFMAERLQIIRDKAYYLEDGYKTFSEFIKEELDINKSTVYNYLKIIDIFGVQVLGKLSKPSNVIPFLPILDSLDDEKKKNLIKEEVINISNYSSFKEAELKAKELKMDFGIKSSTNPLFNKIKRIEKDILALDKKSLEYIIDFAKNKLKSF